MNYRKLRIVFSVTCAIACVLLMVLWGRSYAHSDVAVGGLFGRFYNISSSAGEVAVLGTGLPGGVAIPAEWEVHSVPQLEGKTKLYPSLMEPKLAMAIGIRWKSTPAGLVIVGPMWLPIALGAVFAALPWLRWRFRLRTLLIAITLVAITLGTIIATTR